MSDLCRVQRTSKNHNQRGILEIVVTLKNPNLLNCLHNTSTQPHQHRCSNHFLEPLFLIGINDSAHNQTARASSRCSNYSRDTQLPSTATCVCLHWHVKSRSRDAASTGRHSECVTLQSLLATHGSPSNSVTWIKNKIVLLKQFTLTIRTIYPR